MTPELDHYGKLAEEAQARVLACRYILDLTETHDTLFSVTEYLRLMGVSDEELHQAMNDRQCHGQSDLFNYDKGN